MARKMLALGSWLVYVSQCILAFANVNFSKVLYSHWLELLIYMYIADKVSYECEVMGPTFFSSNQGGFFFTCTLMDYK
jgi:hypothetical protein